MNKTTVKALACLSLSVLTLTVEARWEYYTEGKNSYIRETLADDSVNWVFKVSIVSKDAGELKIADGSGKVAGTSYVKGSGVLDLTDLEQDTGWKLVEVGSSLLGFDEFKNLITGKLVLPE